MGAGVATRPGDAGLQQLQMVSLPVAAEVLLPGSFRLNMELIGTSVENGQDQIMSISPSVALATSERGIFHSALRLGMQASARLPAPQMTWSGLLRGRFEPGLSVELETVRAPVSGSYAAWAGDPSGDFGRIQDTWLGGRISMTPSLDRSIGMLGRAGVLMATNSRLCLGHSHGLVPLAAHRKACPALDSATGNERRGHVDDS